MTDKPEVSVGDIVQISPTAGVVEALQATLAVVDEVRDWGVIVRVKAMGSPHVTRVTETDLAYARIKYGEFEPTGGKAVWVPRRDEGEV